jgi:hypothetical protein
MEYDIHHLLMLDKQKIPNPKIGLGIFYCSILNICLLCFPALLNRDICIHSTSPDFSKMH